jgi:NAD(P)-dependent dehydrogenase (short-subunit alcohol dehydrogenase family)
MRFVSGEIVPHDRMREVLRQGAATPDHILNTKRTPLWVEPGDPTDPESLARAARQAYEEWVRDYKQYYDAQQTGEGMLPAVPRVVLVAGVGMFAVGKDSRAATISSDIYHHTIGIIESAEGLGGYRSLSLEDAFAAEYWPLELYKLTLAPPEKALSRRVVLVTGAAGAIGAGIARRFASEGAHVVCADLDLDKSGALAAEFSKANPANRSIAVSMDVTDEASVAGAYKQVVLEYGGVDVVVSNAGIAKSCPIDELSLEDWEGSFAVNARGHFLVAREALCVMKAQGTGGSFVFIATKNVTAPGKEFAAYSASKAAEAQLARVLALEGAPHGIRSNMVNPDAVFAGSGLWSQEVREQRARAQGIDPGEIEEHYRKRNLLQVEVTAADVAEAALFYASDRSAKTTGSMLPVDGGLREAFPR